MLENKEVDIKHLDLCCSENILPECVIGKGREIILKERETIISRLPSFGAVYGFNTLTGHRDNVVFSEDEIDEFNQQVVKSHCIGSSPWFSAREVKYIVFSKIYSLSLGGSGASSGIFDALCLAWLDESISAAEIPCDDTYSSGDVIPGAHLAKFLREEKDVDFKLGDMIAMINGSFVHSGYALSARSDLICVADSMMHTISKSLSVVGVEEIWKENFLKCIDKLYPESLSIFTEKKMKNKATNTQVSVSFRALPELFQAFSAAFNHFDLVLESCFSKPSANPLFVNEGKAVVSQASFLCPELALATSQLIDALQYAAWQSLQRIKFMLNPLSGNRQDAAIKGLDLGLIQVPKRLQARLDSHRLALGTRPFSLGSDTSFGIEDAWTYGVSLVSQLKRMAKFLGEILVEESAVSEYILLVEKGESPIYNEVVKNAENQRRCLSSSILSRARC